MEQKKYSIIYADPPWRYDIKKGEESQKIIILQWSLKMSADCRYAK